MLHEAFQARPGVRDLMLGHPRAGRIEDRHLMPLAAPIDPTYQS